MFVCLYVCLFVEWLFCLSCFYLETLILLFLFLIQLISLIMKWVGRLIEWEKGRGEVPFCTNLWICNVNMQFKLLTVNTVNMTVKIWDHNLCIYLHKICFQFYSVQDMLILFCHLVPYFALVIILIETTEKLFRRSMERVTKKC